MEAAASRRGLRAWRGGFYPVLIAFVVCFGFFFEYLPPFRFSYIPFDLSGYHYPLMDGAFRTLKSGRFPGWDPAIYCGIPLAGNIQAALFYPGTWMLFLVNWGNDKLSYESLQDMMILHFVVTLVLAYRWLRGRELGGLAAALGAGLFAFGGFPMTQLQHFGLVAGFAWWPLALAGIDEAAAEGRWRPLWKVVVSSALVLLAGYPPFWVVFAITVTVYAMRMALPVIAALAVSLPLCAVQLLPALEATQTMVRDARYSLGSGGAAFFLTYLMPNAFDFGLEVAAGANPGFDYWYMGAAGVFGFIAAFRAGWRRTAAGWGVLAVSLILLLDPYGMVNGALSVSPFLLQLVRAWYFTGGIAAALALLAAEGLDAFLRAPSRLGGIGWAGPLLVMAAMAWCGRLLYVWYPGGAEFAHGGGAWVDPAVSLGLFAGAAAWWRAAKPARAWAAAVMLLVTVVELKAFGTSKRFNATLAASAYVSPSRIMPGVEARAFAEMAAHPEYRVAVSASGPFGQDLRHYGLATPQGFDPLLPAAYQNLVQTLARFYTDREFALDPRELKALGALGVRYFLAPAGSPELQALEASADFVSLDGGEGFARAFEWKAALPVCRWRRDPGTVRAVEWLADRRVVEVASEQGGELLLAENHAAGWEARIDGSRTRIERCEKAFQCITVPAGAHRVEFRYGVAGLGWGAAVSAMTAGAMVAGVMKAGRFP